jgi:hypothetical protein
MTVKEWLGILLVSGCIGPQLCAAAQPAAKSTTTPSEVLDEVLVRGKRLNELKAAIVVAEDRFYARYNELNKVDIFDIECAVDAPIGTKIPQRLCLTKLQLNARSDHGREYLQNLQETTKHAPGKGGGSLAPGKPPDTDPDVVWSARYDEYRNNMLDLLKQNRDLQRLAREGEDARKRYNAEYKRRLKGRLILVE